MKEFNALSVDAGIDLGALSAYLRQSGIRHRIFEAQSEQHILVGRKDDVAIVQNLYEDLRDGNIAFEKVEPTTQAAKPSIVIYQLLANPVISLFVLLSLIVSLALHFDTSFQWVGWLLYSQPTPSYAPPYNGFVINNAITGQWWRQLTPIFVHFSIFHIVFNMLWFWEFGRKIESKLGSLFTLGLICSLGVVSNMLQAMLSPFVMFGGMSGVISGLLGFCIVWDKICPRQAFAIPTAIVVSMLIWLALCLFGVVTFVTGTGIANAAHMSGLITGMLLGACFALFERRR